MLGRLAWYLVRRVLQTPVKSIMPMRRGIMLRDSILMLIKRNVGVWRYTRPVPSLAVNRSRTR